MSHAQGLHRAAAGHLLAIASIAFAVALLYARVGHYGYIDFDDTVYLPENAVVSAGLHLDGVRWAFTTLYAANWHPLTWLSHMLDVSLFGLDPGAHHLVNAALHALVGVVFYVFVWRCLGRHDAALLAALGFVLHPQHVESVAWLAERKDMLCALFFLLALLAWMRWLERPGIVRYGAVMLAFACALLAKPMAVSLPVVLLLLDAWPRARLQQAGSTAWRSATALLIEKVPLAALALASCVVTVLAQQRSGAVTGLESLPFPGRLANALLAYALYLRDFVVPDRLALFYPLRSMDLLREIVPATLVLVLLSAATWRLRRSRPALLVGFLWFVITLLPVIGLVHVGSQARADRYMYIPSMGLLLALVTLLPDRLAPAWRRALAASVAVLAFWGALCWMQVGYWETPIALYQRTADVTGENVFAETHLIDHLITNGRLDEAARRSEAALTRHPGRYEGHMSMGNVLLVRGELAAAEAHFRQARARAPRQWHLLNNLGVVLARQGRAGEACAVLREAAGVSPESTMIRENLAAAGCRP